MAILTTFTGTMTKFNVAVEDKQIGAETAKVIITDAVYTVEDLLSIREEAENATIVLQSAAKPQLEGSEEHLMEALDGIKYSGAITVSGTLDNTTLAGVLALTSGKVTADVSGTAAALVAALEAETTVNALKVTVGGEVDASDLKILDAKTSVAVDASAVTAITGTAAELKTVLAAKTIDTAEDVKVTVDGKVSAADLNTIAKATGGVVTAEIEGSAAALNAALKEVSANAIAVTLTGTTATAKDLKELATKTSIKIDASGIETITGNAADVTKVLTDNDTLADNVDVTITGTVTVAEINAINVLAPDGVIKATLEGSAAELATLTTSNSDLLTLKVTGTTATATELIAIDAATSVKVNVSAVTSISDAAVKLKTMYASKTISGLGNEAVTITDTSATAKDANVILKATSGIVTASVTDTAADLVKDLTDAKATDKLTLTVSNDTVATAAADLKALDAKTSVAVDASLVTGIKGTAADVKTVLKADGITLDKVTINAVAVEVTGTVSAADANTIAKATDGKVTATVASGTAASLKAALTDVTATDALKLKVTGTATVADLLALEGKTSIAVDAKSVTAITGTAGEFATLNALIDHSVDFSSTVAVTVTGAIDASALNIIAGDTFGKVTATVEGSATALQALTTASTDAITVKVTSTTATAAELIAIDKVTSVVVDAKAVKTITALAAEVADVTTVLAAKTIAKAADVAVTINPADDVTALEANSIAKLTTGVVTATVAKASASYLNSTLKDAKATDALTLKVNGTTATAADLNALDAKTKEVITVEATKIEGTLADLNKVFVDVVTSTHFDTTSNSIKNVNITDKTVTAEAVNKIAEATDAAVKATVTADSAANLVSALENTDTNNALTLTVNGTTAKASDLNALDLKTTVNVNVAAVKTITGNESDVTDLYTNSANFTGLTTQAVTITNAIAAADVDKIADKTSGIVTATVTAATATVLNGALQNAVSTDALTLTVSPGTATAAELKALDAKTSVAVDAKSVTTISGNAADVKTVLAATGIDTATNVKADVSGTISAADANTISKATTGEVKATVTADTAAALKSALAGVSNDGVDALALTVTGTTAAAADLIALDAKTSVAVVVNATTVTGDIADVTKVLVTDAGNFTGEDAKAVTISGTVSAAQADAIADKTSGVVTATITADTAAALSTALVTNGDTIVNAYKLTVSDNTTTLASELTALDGKTSVAVDASAVTTISGSSADVAAAYAANTAETITGLGNETVNLTGATDANATLVKAINDFTTGLITLPTITFDTGALTTFNLNAATLGDLSGITGLANINASNGVADIIGIKLADLLAANDSTSNIAFNITGENTDKVTITLDSLAGWSTTNATADTTIVYTHTGGQTVTITTNAITDTVLVG